MPSVLSRESRSREERRWQRGRRSARRPRRPCARAWRKRRGRELLSPSLHARLLWFARHHTSPSKNGFTASVLGSVGANPVGSSVRIRAPRVEEKRPSRHVRSSPDAPMPLASSPPTFLQLHVPPPAPYRPREARQESRKRICTHPLPRQRPFRSQSALPCEKGDRGEGRGSRRDRRGEDVLVSMRLGDWTRADAN